MLVAIAICFVCVLLLKWFVIPDEVKSSLAAAMEEGAAHLAHASSKLYDSIQADAAKRGITITSQVDVESYIKDPIAYSAKHSTPKGTNAQPYAKAKFDPK